MTLETKEYTVIQAGFLFGDFYDAGRKIVLNEKQARRFVEEGRIALAKLDVKRPVPAKTVEGQ